MQLVHLVLMKMKQICNEKIKRFLENPDVGSQSFIGGYIIFKI